MLLIDVAPAGSEVAIFVLLVVVAVALIVIAAAASVLIFYFVRRRKQHPVLGAASQPQFAPTTDPPTEGHN